MDATICKNTNLCCFLSVRKMMIYIAGNGENMLLFQDIGLWYNLVVDKMPGFTTDVFRDLFPDASPAPDRIAVPITDQEFNVSCYLVCGKANEAKLKALFQ